jgi:integrase
MISAWGFLHIPAKRTIPIEDVQYLAGHASPTTTRVYDRRRRKVTRNIVERISIEAEHDNMFTEI